MRRGVDAGSDEALELLPAIVEDADRRVARAGDLARDVEELLQDRLHVELGCEGRDPRVPARSKPEPRNLLLLAGLSERHQRAVTSAELARSPQRVPRIRSGDDREPPHHAPLTWRLSGKGHSRTCPNERGALLLVAEER
jgi:hypothetical protein